MLVAAVLSPGGVRGAVILGVLAATALGLIFGVLDGPDGVIDVPGSATSRRSATRSTRRTSRTLRALSAAAVKMPASAMSGGPAVRSASAMPSPGC